MGSTESDSQAPSSGAWWGDLSRRAFLRRGSLTAAAVGVVGSVPGLSSLLVGGASEAPAVESGVDEADSEGPAVAGPLVAHIKDYSTGEMSLFQGEREVLV